MITAFLIGVALAVVLAAAARFTGFDRDRSFYPTVLIVIASYYVLFAVMAGQAVAIETVFALAFSAIAIMGAFRWAPIVGVGIVAHGLFDVAHPHLIDNPGVPKWWPPFCAGVDVVLGAWVIWLALQRRDPHRAA